MKEGSGMKEGGQGVELGEPLQAEGHEQVSLSQPLPCHRENRKCRH